MLHREKKGPYSYQVLDSTIERGEAKDLAELFVCTPQYIRSLCRAPEANGAYVTANTNFLDAGRTWIKHIEDKDGAPNRAYPIGHYVAGLLGGSFVPRVAYQGEPDPEIMNHFSSILKEVGEAVEEARNAWFVDTPGRITEKQRIKCKAEVDDAMAVLQQLKDWLEQKANENDRS